MAQVVLRNNWYAPDGRFYTSNFPGPSEVSDQLVRFLPTSAVVYSGSHTAPSPNRPIMAHLTRQEESFDPDAYAKSVAAEKPAEKPADVVEVDPAPVEAAQEVDPAEAEQRRLEAEEAAADNAAAANAAAVETVATPTRPSRRRQ